MPENQLTPEQNQWAKKVFKHLQWKYPESESNSNEEDELEEVALGGEILRYCQFWCMSIFLSSVLHGFCLFDTVFEIDACDDFAKIGKTA
ncbi:hypothetical protein SAMN04515695_2570 [Pseudovibrio sp. Tun.PSC04-5.I4]|nr:hypothetical protein SAMN04515695_2570 [Pseudovibrio sp. Tun.PSC04-5.I4]